MRLIINKENVSSLISGLYEALSGSWTKVTEVDYKGLCRTYGIPASGIIATNLITFLIKKDVLVEHRGGRNGTSWKLSNEFIDIDSITNRYINYLNSISYDQVKLDKMIYSTESSKVRPAIFNLKDKILILENNMIRTARVTSIRLRTNDLIEYGCKLMNPLPKDSNIDDLRVRNHNELFIDLQEVMEYLKETMH